MAARVDALESSLSGRLDVLEARPYFTVEGTITVEYKVGRTDGFEFDVDRVYGLNGSRSMGASVFSSGAASLNAANTNTTEVGEVAQDRTDIVNKAGDVAPVLSLSFAFVDTKADIVLELVRAYNVDANAGGTVQLNQPYVFNLKEFKSTFTGIGGAPVTFDFGVKLSGKFTNYVGNFTDQQGYRVTVGAPEFLAALNPGLVGIYWVNAAGTDYYRGIRGTLAPTLGGIGLSGGVSFVQLLNFDEEVQRTVFGADGSVDLLGLLKVSFEYASSAEPEADADTILWVVADLTADLPILDSLTVNYRDTATTFNGLGTGLPASSLNFPLDQTGFGVTAGLDLFIIDATVFYDTYQNAAEVTFARYGGTLKADLFAGFSLSGGITVAADADGAVPTHNNNGGTRVTTGYNVSLKHDAKSADALIPGLGLEVSYKADSVAAGEAFGFDATTLTVAADYALSVSFLSLTPYVSYTMFANALAPATDYTSLMAGTGLSVDLSGVIAAPKLDGAVNYRNTAYEAFTATELQWSVGLTLNEFLFDSVLAARVGQWQGTNTAAATNSLGTGDGATDISGKRGNDTNGVEESVFGWEVVWTYSGLQFAYGMYDSERSGVTGDNGEATAQSFSIKYSHKF
jgi:hypothetical protein